MIKEEGVNGKENECWSFKNNGKKFIVFKRNQLFTFKVYDELTGEWFQSQEVELYKINQKTIEAAFDSKITSVSHQFLQTSQKDAILRFIIKLQYIATQFKEEIDMKKLQMSKQNAMKLQYEELKQEISQVEKMIDFQTKMNAEKQIIIERNGYAQSSEGPIYEVEAKKGKHLLTITGSYLSQAVYDGDYGDECGEQYANMQHLNNPLKTRINIGKEQVIELISQKPSFQDGYEVPFVVSTVLDLKKQETINILLSLQNGGNAVVNQSMLTIFPFNQIN